MICFFGYRKELSVNILLCLLKTTKAGGSRHRTRRPTYTPAKRYLTPQWRHGSPPPSGFIQQIAKRVTAYIQGYGDDPGAKLAPDRKEKDLADPAWLWSLAPRPGLFACGLYYNWGKERTGPSQAWPRGSTRALFGVAMREPPL